MRSLERTVCMGRACIVIIRWTYSADLSLSKCSGRPDTKACPPIPILAAFFQFHLEESAYGARMCKLGVISQERLKIEVKLLVNADRN